MNADFCEPSMTLFWTLFKLKNVVKEPAWKSKILEPRKSQPPRFLTNYVTILQTSFELQKNLKSFDEKKFRFLFKKRLNELNTDDITVGVFTIVLCVLSTVAPLKRKYLSANDSLTENLVR